MKKITSILVLLSVLSLILTSLSIPLVWAADDFWVKMSDTPTEMQYCGVAVVNGKICVIGEGDSFNYEYDPETDTWTSKTLMPTARSGFGTAVYQNKIWASWTIKTHRTFLTI